MNRILSTTNVSKFAKAIFIFTLIYSPIFSTEETNPHPFFFVNQNKIQFFIYNKNIKLCSVKSKSLLNYDEFKILFCNDLKPNLSSMIQSSIDNNDKKEITFLFLDESNKIYNPIVKIKKKEMKVLSIIYNVKENGAYLELSNSKNKYFFLGFDYKKVIIENG